MNQESLTQAYHTLRETVDRLQLQRDELADALRRLYSNCHADANFRDYHEAKKKAGELLNRLGKRERSR